MNLYNKAQLDYREGCKARIKRQMEISKNRRIDVVTEVLLSHVLLLCTFSLNPRLDYQITQPPDNSSVISLHRLLPTFPHQINLTIL